MTDHSSNDNRALPALKSDHPDAHGQAAILLVESLIHGLIAQSHISVAKAVEIVEVALEVSRDIAEESGEVSAATLRSTTLLQNISKSLSRDLPR